MIIFCSSRKRYILDQLKDIVESTEPEWIKTHSAIDLYESRLKEAVVRFNRHQERYLEHSKDFLIDHEQRFRDVYQKFLGKLLEFSWLNRDPLILL